MLGADGLNLAMMLAESDIIDNAVNELVSYSRMVMLPENRAIKTTVAGHIAKWSSRVKSRITKVGDSEQFQQELALYQEVICLTEYEFYQQLPDIIDRMGHHSSFSKQAHKLVSRNKGVESPMFPHYFCEQWYLSLSSAIKQAGIDQIESDKEKFLADLYQRIETMKHINEVSPPGESAGLGRLWDMSAAKLSKGDITSMKKYAAFLKKNTELKAIAEQLGRMASEVDSSDQDKARSEQLKLVEDVSDEATDDIVGIHESDDINKMLPYEAMFLAYPELEVVFYKHLVDKQLLNYKMQGKSRTLRRVTSHKSQVKEADIEKGPFVICVDASGSMEGFPEQCAKAMAYALMQIALAENRDCFVMMFSTAQITYELTGNDGLREASDFLSYQFRGGTDFESVLVKSVELMSGGKYSNADLVVLSDFMAPKQPEAILEQVRALREKKNRFHAISLSRYGNPQLMEMFDHCWDYHPNVINRMVKRW